MAVVEEGRQGDADPRKIESREEIAGKKVDRSERDETVHF